MGMVHRPKTSLGDDTGFAGELEELWERVRRLELRRTNGFGVYYDLAPNLHFTGSYDSAFEGWAAVEYIDSDGPVFGVHVTAGRAFMVGAIEYQNSAGDAFGSDLFSTAMPPEARPAHSLVNVFCTTPDTDNESTYPWPTLFQWDVTRSGFINFDYQSLPTSPPYGIEPGAVLLWEGVSWMVGDGAWEEATS